MNSDESRGTTWSITAAFWGAAAVWTLFTTDGLAGPAACVAAAQTALILGGWGVRR